MPSDGSVSHWIGGLQDGDPKAIEQLWQRYFHRLVGLARAKLRQSPGGMADEEDVALSAFDSFCRNAERGRFPDLSDRDSLWRLLVVMTARKAAHLRRDEGRQKRGGGNERTDPALIEAIVGHEPTPGFAAEAAEEFQRLLDLLKDSELQSVALWKMEGCAVEEIAGRLHYSPRSIKRKLQLIRTLWEKEIGT
jgi:DNA-directed RNA polymerase specialized sigma24 family protein